RSQPKSPPERTPFSFLIRPAGMPRKPWWLRATSRSCRCRRVHPSSTARKTSGNSCARIGYQTGSLNPSTTSSATAATPGTNSTTKPGRSCPSRGATGKQSVTQSEDWYKLKAMHEAFLARLVEEGPIPAIHGVVRWRACDLITRLYEEFGLSVSDDTIYRALK